MPIARAIRRIAPAIAIAALCAGCAASSSEIYQVPADIASPAPRNAAAEIVRLINRERAARGLAPLTVDANLARAAQAHARRMAVADCYAHLCPGELELGDRARQAGYHYRKITENIHAAQRDPHRVVAGWMNSRRHRGNILDPDVGEIGVGHFYLAQDGGGANHHHYWVANFGDRP